MTSAFNNDKHLCEPCLFDQTECSAIAFCVSCLEYLCKDCARDHKRNKVTRDHRVLENDNVPKDPSIYKKLNEILSCCKHPTDKVTYYCEDHNQFICVTCLAVDHRRCENVGEIKHQAVNEALPAKLEKLSENVDEIKSLRNKNLTSLLLQHKHVAKEQVDFVKNLIEDIVNQGDRLKAETERLVKPYVTELEKSVSNCEAIASEVRACKNLLQGAMQLCDGKEIVVISEFVKKAAGKLETEHDNQRKMNIPEIKVVFDTNNTLLELVKNIGRVSCYFHRTETESMAITSMHSTSDELREDIDTSDVTETGGTRSEVNERTNTSFLERNVSYTSVHFVRSGTDKYTCSVNGITILASGLVVIIDKNNRKIKAFNNNFQMICEKQLVDVPTGICKVSESFAVLSEGCKHITIFEIRGDTVYSVRQLSTRFHALSITSRHEWDVFLLFSDKPTVTASNREILQLEIRNLFNGRIAQTIDIMKYFDGGSLTDTHNIQYTVKGGLIISERDKCHYFEHTNDELREKWFYKSHGKKSLMDVSCIESDIEGNVYVCGKKSRNIHQVSASNYRNSRIIFPSIKDPTAVCVDSNMARMIIGRESGDSIHIFRFDN